MNLYPTAAGIEYGGHIARYDSGNAAAGYRVDYRAAFLHILVVYDGVYGKI